MQLAEQPSAKQVRSKGEMGFVAKGKMLTSIGTRVFLSTQVFLLADRA